MKRIPRWNPIRRERSNAMSVSSVSSYSNTLWEEYLEQLQKKQQQKESASIFKTDDGGASAVSSIPAPDEILSELQELQGDPEGLKARAAELAAQVAEHAGRSAGIRAIELNELAADLEEVAVSGNLSVIQEKLASKSGAAGPKGPPSGGISGASGISSKLLEAFIEDEDDEEEYASLDLDALVSKFQTIKEISAAKTQDAAAEENDTSVDALISKIRDSLSDQLRALYAQSQIRSSTVSLSG